MKLSHSVAEHDVLLGEFQQHWVVKELVDTDVFTQALQQTAITADILSAYYHHHHHHHLMIIIMTGTNYMYARPRTKFFLFKDVIHQGKTVCEMKGLAKT